MPVVIASVPSSLPGLVLGCAVLLALVGLLLGLEVDVLEGPLPWQTGRPRRVHVDAPVQHEPQQYGGAGGHHLLDHDVEVERRADEHAVPEQRQRRHQAKEHPHLWRVRQVAPAQVQELVQRELRQDGGALCPLLRSRVGVEPQVLLVPYHLPDSLPTQVGLALLYQEEAVPDQQEAVPGYVESFPAEASRQALCLVQELCPHSADSEALLHQQEGGGGSVPDAGGQHQAGHLVLDDDGVAAAVGVAGDEDEEAADEERPAPAQLDEVGVEEVVGSGKVAGGLRGEVADHAQHKDPHHVGPDL